MIPAPGIYYGWNTEEFGGTVAGIFGMPQARFLETTVFAQRPGGVQTWMLSQLVDHGRHINVALTEASGLIVGEHDRHAIIDVAPVGMMIETLGKKGDLVYECEGIVELS